ncbi:MAG: ABC transporter permease [Chloroflexota bacterium]
MTQAKTIVKQRSLWEHVVELTRYQELTYNLVVRELKTRYKNSVLGFFWSLLNPLGMMLVFTFVFGVLLPNETIENYPIFLLCGLLPWYYFQNSVMSSLHSIIGNASLVKKVYFPREILPIANVISQFVNFILALCVLFVIIIIFQATFSPWLWLLPVIFLIQTCFTLGLSLMLATLNVFYRDTAMIMEVLMLAWFFLTPIFYPLDLIPQSITLLNIELNVHRLMYIFNPMASIINTYRDILYWGYRTNFDFFLRTAVTSFAILLIGYWVFIRYSGTFGEEV